MKTDIVEFSTALLARDKGYINGSDFYFDINTEHLFVWNDMIGSIGCKNGNYPEQIEAPYRSELQKWLRGKGVEMTIDCIHLGGGYDKFYCVDVYNNFQDRMNSMIFGIDNNRTKFHSYESALEEGLKHGLTLIEI